MLELNTIAVVVRDEKKAARFWTEKVGLRLKDKYPHWHTVVTPGSKIRLHLCPDAPPEKGNTGIAFRVKDVAREEKRLRRKGVRVTVPTTKEDWGTYFMFADPDGNEFWVFGE
jgi:catechol 2,3-dioxygenase-like lactoylglutathione lyase family enzyme